MKILVSGDWHIDAAKVGRVDPSTDLDIRTLDFLKAVDYMIDYAIENEVDLFIMNGDLFRGRTSSHLIETLVAERFRRITNHMQLLINLGNHDYTAKSLTYNNHTYSIIERLNIDNAVVNENLNHIQYDDVDIVLYPYYDCKSRAGFSDNEQLLKFIRDRIDAYNLQKDCKLFIGHGTPDGTAISNEWFFDLGLIDEPILPRKMLEDKFDFSLFSHIHRMHYIGKKIFHIGSPERVDFSEANHDKGFSIYDTSTKTHSFISTNPRPMADLKIDLSDLDDFTDPTEHILEEISSVSNLEECLFKVQVDCTVQVKSTIDHKRIKDKLDTTFHYDIRYNPIQEERQTRLASVTETIGEVDALDQVINSKSDLSEADKKQLLVRGKGVIAIHET